MLKQYLLETAAIRCIASDNYANCCKKNLLSKSHTQLLNNTKLLINNNLFVV